MTKISLVPARRGRRYECFACGTELIAPFTPTRCLRCGERENFYLMN